MTPPFLILLPVVVGAQSRGEITGRARYGSQCLAGTSFTLRAGRERTSQGIYHAGDVVHPGPGTLRGAQGVGGEVDNDVVHGHE